MKKIIRITLLFWIVFVVNACSKNNLVVFGEMYDLIGQNNYFKARELYFTNKDALSKPYQSYIEAVLDNAFNKLEASETAITKLLRTKYSLPDSLLFKLQEVRYDNALKLYHYQEAKITAQTILTNYEKFLDAEQTEDYKNGLLIWTALENTPAQKVEVRTQTNIKMVKDLAGLNTLKLAANNDSLDFIFDTGANLSTTSLSTAKRFNMNIIPVDIQVGTITGEKVLSQLAVCDKLTLGNIDLDQVVFLVLPDEALSFPQINYRIFGILGYPVIEALKEIRLTQDGDFIVASDDSEYTEDSNMAMRGLTPLIFIDNKQFTFDTGADHTILYHKFYMENKKEIDENYQPEQVSFAGAAGKKDFEGYNINYTFDIGGKSVKLENISLLKEKVKESETVYGNIGRDVIQQFNTMIINFDKMFIRFE